MTYPAFGALNASLADMRQFMSALLNNGRLSKVEDDAIGIHPDNLRHLFTPASSLGIEQGLQVGYAAGMYGRVANGHVFYGHGGDADGYRSRYGVHPRSGRGYLVVINTDNPDLLARMVRRILAELTDDLPAQPAPASYPHTSTTLEPLTGDYYPASARFGLDVWQNGQAHRLTVRLNARENGLQVIRGRRTTPLISTGPLHFRRPKDPQTTVIFVRDRAGSLYLQGELGNYVNLLTCRAFIRWCNSQ
jgi:hypothetical protein